MIMGNDLLILCKKNNLASINLTISYVLFEGQLNYCTVTKEKDGLL